MKKDSELIKKAVKICKEEREKARANGKGGTNWPGKKALEAYPDILPCVIDELDEIICVIGTNGKTTTCRLIDNILTKAGIGHAHNREGANLLGGILTTLLLNYDDNCHPKNKTALLECDEMAFAQLSSLLNPKIIVCTNLFADQEFPLLVHVEQVTGYLIKAILKCPNAILCLNSDCKQSMKIAEAVPNQKIFYSVKDKTAFVDGKIIKTGMLFDSAAYTYNAAAACAFAKAYRISENTSISAIHTTKPAFGRMESIRIGNHTVIIEMMKNTGGFKAFSDYAIEHAQNKILIMSVWDINPKFTKWMENVDFSPLFSLFAKVYTSGPGETAKTFLDYPSVSWLSEEALYNKIIESEQDVIVLVDYDGNIDIHNLLAKKNILRPFWEN